MVEMWEIPAAKKELKKIFDEKFKTTSNAYSNYLDCYWSGIFPKELEVVEARERGSGVLEDFRSPTQSSPDKGPAMIMPIGQSYEPLVLAVHLVRPRVIFAIHRNENLLEKFKESLNKAANSLQEARSYSKTVKGVYLSLSDNPNIGEAALLFRILRDPSGSLSCDKETAEELENELGNGNVIFDITGAKKTMSGGCFLFAAYYDIPVYYMDFDSEDGAYHPDLGRPYPGRCFYTRQPSPISGFGLKKVRDIKQAFDERRFPDVVLMLDELIQVMGKGVDEGYFDEKEIDLYGNMKRVAEVYADWQEGAYGKRGGKDLGERLAEIAPELVDCREEKLFKYAGIFPSRDQKAKKFNADYYAQIKPFCSYVLLELARLLRKSTLSNPTLFLRAFALEEFLIGFIYWQFINEGSLCFLDENGEYISLRENTKKSFCNENYGRLEHYLIKSANGNPLLVENHGLGSNKLNAKGLSLTLIFGNDCVVKYVEKFRGGLWKSSNRNKRDKLAHFTHAVSDDEVDNLLDLLVKIWRFLLDKKPEWFLDCDKSYANQLMCLVGKDGWYQERPVAPLKYEDVEKILKREFEQKIKSQDEEIPW